MPAALACMTFASAVTAKAECQFCHYLAVGMTLVNSICPMLLLQRSLNVGKLLTC